MMSLADFPLDVLLELTKELDLPDALRLSATCALCATVLSSPSFWIGFLRRIEQVHNRPIPCTPGTDIAGLPLKSLRKMAIHAYQLMKNWDSDAPRVVSFRTIKLEGGGKIWQAIPIHGEHLFISFSDTHIACWDATTGQCLAAHDRDSGPTAPWVHNRSGFPFFLARKCYIGLAYCSKSQITLATICVDFEDPTAIVISTILSRTWPTADGTPQLRPFWVTVVNDHTIGAVIEFNDPSITPVLLFCRVKDGELRRLPLNMRVHNWEQLTGLAINDGFFVTTHSFNVVQMLHARPSSVNGTDLLTDKTDVDQFTRGHNLRHPTYGVVNVTMAELEEVETFPDAEYVEDWRQGIEFSLNFWVADSDSVTLSNHSIIAHAHDQPIDWLAVGSAGRFVVIADEPGFALVQYTAQPRRGQQHGHVSLKRLHVSRKLRKFSLWKGALDDRLGLLYLLEPRKVEKPRVIVASFV